MGQEFTIAAEQFAALRREFVFKIDGDRPILYPLDYINTHIHILQPIQGFVLSLLDGRTRFSDLDRMFRALFPESPLPLLDLLASVDTLVRNKVSMAGIGRDGLIEVSDAPIPHAPRFDSRHFVVGGDDFRTVMGDVKQRFRLRAPINVYTVTTHRCHTDCLYCYADRKKLPEMALSRWQEILAEMAGLGVRLCSPDNGDTFARKDGVDIIESMLRNDMHFLLSTKIFLSKPTIGRLMEAGLGEKVNGVIDRPVQLSIDSVDEALGMRLLNVTKPRHQKNVETFNNFMSFGIMPIVKCVVTGLNANQPLPIVEQFYALGGRRFSFVRYTRSLHRHTDDLFLGPQHAETLTRQFAEIRERFPDIVLNENVSLSAGGPIVLTAELKQRLWDGRIGCGGGWHSLGIGPDGKAFLCEQMAYEEPYFVGDASRQTIAEIWNSDATVSYT
ncbi:MAG TPA: radical SAM protein, partial [Rhodospirillum rubrum]|nr:radical SAM protein [Rhodospirillum rubrum]